MNLALFVALAFVSAFTFAIAHAIVPSLLVTGELPQRANQIRYPFYFLSFVTMLAALAALAMSLFGVGVIHQVYPRWWI